MRKPGYVLDSIVIVILILIIILILTIVIIILVLIIIVIIVLILDSKESGLHQHPGASQPPAWA